MTFLKKIEFAVLVFFVTVWGIATFQRNLVWKDDFSLWSDSVGKSPGKARPHNYLGIACQKRGAIDEAIRHYKRAITITPRYSYARVNLGICYFDKGDVDGAIREFKHAISISPRNADAHYNLGIAYGTKGWYQDAFREIHIAKALSSPGKWDLLRREMKRR